MIYSNFENALLLVVCWSIFNELEKKLFNGLETGNFL